MWASMHGSVPASSTATCVRAQFFNRWKAGNWRRNMNCPCHGNYTLTESRESVVWMQINLCNVCVLSHRWNLFLEGVRKHLVRFEAYIYSAMSKSIWPSREVRYEPILQLKIVTTSCVSSQVLIWCIYIYRWNKLLPPMCFRYLPS